MEQNFRGQVVAIWKDLDFNGKLIAKIDTNPEMHFFVNRLKVKEGDIVEIIKEENEMNYKSVKVKVITK